MSAINLHTLNESMLVRKDLQPLTINAPARYSRTDMGIIQLVEGTHLQDLRVELTFRRSLSSPEAVDGDNR